MKTSVLSLLLLFGYSQLITAQDCEVQIPQDTFVCNLNYTLTAYPVEGKWSNLCDLSPGVADFFTINDSLTSITVSECGDYFLQFEYALFDSTQVFDTISLDPLVIDTLLQIDTTCLVRDTMALGFSNSASAEFNLLVNVSARYPETSCIPNDTVNCMNRFSLENAEPPEMEWTFQIFGLCENTVLNTTVVDQTDCEAEQISFENTTFSGMLADTSVVFSSRFAEIDPVTGEILSYPFQEALDQVVDEAIAASEAQCPLPMFCNNSPPWCIDTLRDTSILIVPVRMGGQWQLFPGTDSSVVLLDTTQLVISDSTYLIYASPSANAYDSQFDIFQINYEGDTIPAFSPGILRMQWEEIWDMDTITQILPRLVDTCCGGGLNIDMEVFDPPPPVYDCPPFSVIFLEELETEAALLDCNQDTYGLQVKIRGGNPPYEVTGLTGTLEDSLFLAENIPISQGYSLLITDQDNCQATLLGDACPCVEVEALTDLNVPLRCDEDCTLLTGSGTSLLSDSLSYQWEQDTSEVVLGFGDSLEVCDTGLYRFVVTEFYSECKAILDVQVDRDIPFADVGDSLTLNCDYSTVMLGGDSLSIDSSIFYFWSGPGIDSVNQNQTFPQIDTGGTYELIVLDTLNACADTNIVNIGMDFEFPFAYAGVDKFENCQEELFRLGTFSTSVGDNIRYQWTGPAFIDPDTIALPRTTTPGTYILTVRNINNGCESRDTVVVHPFVPIDFEVSTRPSCWNENNGTVIFENATGGTPPYAYSIDGNLFRPFNTLSYAPPGEIVVVVRDRDGCRTTKIVEVGVIPEIEDPPLVAEQFRFCGPVELNLDLTTEVSPNDTLTYLWSDSTTSPTNQITEGGNYQVIVNSTCETFVSNFQVIEDLEILTRFQVPNIFSPNNDGVNDIFRVITDLEVENMELQVYNRWGQKVFETSSVEEGWDGMMNGSIAASDVYVWTVNVRFTRCDGENDDLFLKGDLTLIR